MEVRIQEVTKERAEVEKLEKHEGALVASVSENSPAEKEGIKAGDIILEFDGKLINTMNELPRIVAETEVGKKVNVKVWRNKREINREIILGRLETSEDFKAEKKEEAEPNISEIKTLKISVRVLSAKDVKIKKLPEGTSGLVITNIQQDSPINYLKVNNIIIEAQKKKIRSVKDPLTSWVVENDIKLVVCGKDGALIEFKNYWCQWAKAVVESLVKLYESLA